MPYDFDLFVIGGGSGGTGGTCVNIGCVPKKLMVMAAEYGHALRDSHGFGWTTARGEHDWATLIANKDSEIARLTATYRRLLNNAGAMVFDARARLVDAHTLDVGGQTVTAERIVIATGGRPLTPSFPGCEHAIVSDDAFYLPERPRRVAILGGGYIAVEFANIFSGLGSKVDLVFRQELPLRGFDEDIRTALDEALEADGITLHRSASIASVTLADGAKRVTLTDGAVLEADLVFAAVGRTPLTDGLGLPAAGVKLDGFGAVAVDGEGRTSQPSVYAIGDVTDRMNLTPVAIAEGHALADRLFGDVRRSWELRRVATAVFSSPPIATVGLSEQEAATRGPADIYLTRFTPMRHTLGGRTRRSMMKLVVDQQSQLVLGAHMIGDDAPEIMQGVSVALNCGATKADFDRTVGIHPTSAEEFVTLRTRTRTAGVPTLIEQDAQEAPADAMGMAEAGLGS